MVRRIDAAPAAATPSFTGGTFATEGATGKMAGTATTPQAHQTPFAIIYRAGPAWRRDVPMERQDLRAHFFYLRALDQDGRIILAGPVGPEGGLVVLTASDQADADAVVATDPAVVAGVFVADAMPFIPRFVGQEALSPVGP